VASSKPRKRRKSRRAKRSTFYPSEKCASPVLNLRSGWERAYVQYLEDCDAVIEYDYEPYAIEYVSNKRTGKKRRYWPDFEVKWEDGRTVIVEIKPKKKVTQARNVKKMTAARAYAKLIGCEYVVVTEVELKNLGLLV